MDLAPSPRSLDSSRRFDADIHQVVTERSLALARVWIAVGTSILIFFDLPRIGLPPISGLGYAVGFTAYSLLILILLRKQRECSKFMRLGLCGTDLVWVGLLPLITGEFRVALPLLVLFLLVASAERWGLSGVFKTAGGIAILVLCESVLLGSVMPTTKSSAFRSHLGYDLTPVLFALFAGGLLGLRVRKERERRWETAARAVESERARIAREIHDRAIQVLYAVESQLEVLKHHRPRSVANVSKELGIAQKLLRISTEELRELIQQARPLDLGSKSFLEYIADWVEDFHSETGIAVRFITDGGRASLPPAVAHELVRIVQEALVNVRKHSGARNVLIRFSSEKGCLKLIVDDDGRGFDFTGRLSLPELTATRRGPAVIRERVCTLGGELAIESTPGRGSRLEIALSPETYG